MSEDDDTDRPEPERQLLFLSIAYPYPLDRGQHVRIHQLVKACSRDHRVTLMTPPPGADGPDTSLESLCKRVIYVAEAEGSRVPQLRDSLRFWRSHGVVRRPGSVARLTPWSKAVAALPMDTYSLVWVERLLLTAVLRAHWKKTIVDLDDLEHRKWARTARMPGVRPTSRRAIEAYYTVRFFVAETLSARRFLTCVVASPEDAAHLRHLSRGTVATVPNGVDVHVAPELSPVSSRKGRRAVFLGNLAYGPNVDALTVLSEQLLPALQKAGLPTAVDVYGPGADADMARRFPELSLRGYVADLPSALAGYDFFLAPLRLGGGTKLKVLEAMAVGLPVVTTPVGAEGLGVQHGVHAFVASSVEEMVASVRKISEDPALGSSVGAAGRRLVADKFAWASVRRGAADLLLERTPT